MPERTLDPLQQKISDRLTFYQDIGIGLFYRDRASSSVANSVAAPLLPQPKVVVEREMPLPKSAPQQNMPKAALASPTLTPKVALPRPASGAPLFTAVEKSSNETLPQIQQDLGECMRCKLHKTRNKIVFGDGSAKAQLMFVGEGPGADEDEQGLPFVGRAGKLLTQMIEAMGLQRKDVYIANVVKCRPPQNRQPEKDEVAACSPFLHRQIDSIQPRVIVCLGSTAAQTILETNRGISQFRGEWLEFRGTKLMCTYHPAYLLRNPPAKSEVWKDLQKVMAELGLEVRKGKSS